MTITFLSNYINHHQIPFCNACYELLGNEFFFVQASPMEEERVAMGWHTDGITLPYVHCLYEKEEKCLSLIEESDILLAGWSEREDLVQKRLLAGKPVIRISERIYREGQWKAISPKGLIHKYREHFRFRNDRAYLLCAGAYVASDFALIKSYPEKMYRWGYFPETVKYTDEQWQSLKAKEGILSIVWAGRFMPLKHPEFMIRLAEYLKKRDDLWQGKAYTDFCIHMVGSGEMEQELQCMAKESDVEDKLIFYGFMEPEKVRRIMEKSHIHIFTSNHLEGWGAVVNEAMNSGCAEVANVQAGAVPYLVEHEKNGMIYPDGDFDKMAQAVCFLIENPKRMEEMGRAAYETITSLWNAEQAASELVRFAEGVLKGEAVPAASGPLSQAPVISPAKMYQYLMKKDKEGK